MLEMISNLNRQRKIKKYMNLKWNIIMDSLGSKVENNIGQRYKVLDSFEKSYGIDSIISLPNGLSCVDLRKLIPTIQASFEANVIIEPSQNKSTAYMRIWFEDEKISDKDKIRFKWYKFFHAGNKYRNDFGETYKIESINPIKNPSKEDIGYKLIISIPSQLSYDNLRSSSNDLAKVLNKCFIDFNQETKKVECDVITLPIDNKTKFAPVKVKPWQLYVGIGYDYKPIILDFKITPNVLIGGVVGSGKTVSLIMAFINLCNQCDSFDLYVCCMSEKEDLRIFQNVKQCKSYTNSPSSTVETLKWLNREMKRRNQLFANCKIYCSNIYKYNSLVKPKDRLKIIHVISDEIADFMDYPESQDLLWNLIRKSRSAGIYISMATQRATVANMSPEIKGQLTNKICFNQSNTASALTILSGEGLATKAISLEKSREFIADYSGGVKVGKTLYLDEDMMIDLLKDVQKEAPIQETFEEEAPKIIEKPSKKSEKTHKNSKNVIEITNFKNINSK